jgi:DNA topoisomerase-1
LGNTRTVCRKSYIHPAVLAAYMDGEAIAPIGPARSSRSARVLAPIEFAVVRVIGRRLQSRRD